MSESANAIFLSYASQDADAARRICETLRAAGIEVWFDQSELVGGDAWDQKIRGQIKACALFVPVISANTQARLEGYFRIEWKLAAQRTYAMAEAKPFLLPVVIDGTHDAEVHVPGEFRAVQWTRLPGGETTAAFCARVKQLLAGEPTAAPWTHAIEKTETPSKAPRRRLGWLWAAAGVAVIFGVLFVVLRPSPREPATSTTVSKAVGASPAAPAINEKSIAVLPFVDMSQSKDQEYFSDGISEELLNLLAKIPDLHVAARTSAFSFKGKNVEIPVIAERLHVAHVLEGSVRKSGSKVRITAQLIRAANGYHLWSETYDREMTDIFAVQDEIAAAVVSQMKITLLGAAPKATAIDPKAYAMILQAIYLTQQGTPAARAQAVALDQQALAIAPEAVRAWVNLAGIYMIQANRDERPTAEGRRLAREALNKALAINPDDALAHSVLGWLTMSFDGDNAAAAKHFQRALELEPTNLKVLGNVAVFVQNLGRLDEAIKLLEYSAAHDPTNPRSYLNITYTYYVAGQWDQAIASCRMVITLSPGANVHSQIGQALLFKGDAAGALVEMQAESSEVSRLSNLSIAYHALGRKAESDAALAALIEKYGNGQSLNIASVLAYRGETDRAFEWLDKAVTDRDSDFSHLGIEPLFAKLHSDPRWLPFLRKLGKAPEQLAAIKIDVKLPPN